MPLTVPPRAAAARCSPRASPQLQLSPAASTQACAVIVPAPAAATPMRSSPAIPACASSPRSASDHSRHRVLGTRRAAAVIAQAASRGVHGGAAGRRAASRSSHRCHFASEPPGTASAAFEIRTQPHAHATSARRRPSSRASLDSTVRARLDELLRRPACRPARADPVRAVGASTSNSATIVSAMASRRVGSWSSSKTRAPTGSSE